MTLAEKVLQLKNDIDAVYQAGLSEGGPLPNRVKYEGNGTNTYRLTIKDNTIYTISNCLKVYISPPTKGNYQAYLQISFPKATGAELSFDSSIPLAGNDLKTLQPGETWEVSMDSSLGTLLLNTSLIKS